MATHTLKITIIIKTHIDMWEVIRFKKVVKWGLLTIKKNMITYSDKRIEIFGGVEMLMKKKSYWYLIKCMKLLDYYLLLT